MTVHGSIGNQLNNGATIEYTTSSKPDVKWGTKVTPPSFP